MYSIPVYALRFAAHCRSRLRITELAPADVTRVSPDSAKAWIRFARPHDRQVAGQPDCVTLPPARVRS